MKLISPRQIVRATLVGSRTLVTLAGCSCDSATPPIDNQNTTSTATQSANNLIDANTVDNIISTTTLPNSGLLIPIPVLSAQTRVVLDNEFRSSDDRSRIIWSISFSIKVYCNVQQSRSTSTSFKRLIGFPSVLLLLTTLSSEHGYTDISIGKSACRYMWVYSTN